MKVPCDLHGSAGSSEMTVPRRGSHGQVRLRQAAPPPGQGRCSAIFSKKNRGARALVFLVRPLRRDCFHFQSSAAEKHWAAGRSPAGQTGRTPRPSLLLMQGDCGLLFS